MGLILCIGGCLDGERIPDRGPRVRWFVPRNVEVSVYPDMGPMALDDQTEAHVHEYEMEVITNHRFNVPVYVYTKCGSDWIMRLLEAYMKRADHHAPPSMRLDPFDDHRTDAMRYMMDEMRGRVQPPSFKPKSGVDKSPVDKKPTPEVPKISKVEFSTASETKTDSKKLTTK